MIHRLQVDMERRFREEQEALDHRLDEKLLLRESATETSLGNIEAALGKLLKIANPRPGKDSSAAIQGPGVILSQKQVLTYLIAVSVVVALLLLGVDKETIGGFLTSLLGP